MTDEVEQELGPKPEPAIEPPEPNPGGADAVDGGDDLAEPCIPDLTVEANPAVDEEQAPPVLQEGEDTSTEATESEDAEEDAEKAAGESTA